MTVSIVLADDHQLVRRGLRTQLEEVTSFAVSGEASSRAEVLESVEREQPDVLLQDLSLGQCDGVEVAREARRLCSTMRVIAVTMHRERIWLERALGAGFNGYVLKDDAFEDLTYAIQSVMRGGVFVSPMMVSGNSNARLFGGGDSSPELTPRERDILTLVGDGMSSRQVAEQLHISVKTVEAHRGRISEKLGFSGIADYTKFAIRRGWVSC